MARIRNDSSGEEFAGRVVRKRISPELAQERSGRLATGRAVFFSVKVLAVTDSKVAACANDGSSKCADRSWRGLSVPAGSTSTVANLSIDGVTKLGAKVRKSVLPSSAWSHPHLDHCSDRISPEINRELVGARLDKGFI